MGRILSASRHKQPIDPAAVAADWNARGYSCASFVDPPGRKWLDFVHDCNELVTVVEGRLKMEVAGEWLEAGPGDEIFIPSGARHSVINIHDGTTVWLYGYD